MATKKAAAPTEIEKVVEEKAVALPSFTMGRRQDAVEQVTSLQELATQFRTDLVSWQDIEPSFTVVKKDTLAEVPFVIAGFRLNESTKFMTRDAENPEVLVPGRFVSLLVAAYDEDSGEFISPWVIVNDGSTGIRDQLLRYVKKVAGDADIDSTITEFNMWAGRVPPIRCEKGLRASRYPYEDADGNVSEATTWYIG